MASRSGRYVITFNGEIYNFRRLRSQLVGLGHTFRSSSDMEVILAAIEAWGLQRAVSSFVGMFAFALWDAERGELTSRRDRLRQEAAALRTMRWRCDLRFGAQGAA